MFAYEEAEVILDIYAATKSAQFRRAYLRFKCALFAIAYADYKSSSKEALSYTWEDARIAFSGHGDSMLSGAVLHMWTYVDDGEVKQFSDAIVTAFAAADAATESGTKRRYTAKQWSQPILTKYARFDKDPILPSWGPTLRDWAFDNDEDPLDYEEAHDLLAAAVSAVAPDSDATTRSAPIARKHIRLLNEE